MAEVDKAGDSEQQTGQGRRVVVITILTVILVGVTVAVLQIIGKAPAAGEGMAGGGGPQGMPPAAVYVVQVEREETQELAVVTGSLRPVSQAEVAAREPGAVTEVLVDEGQMVEKGAVLARLDTRRVQARLEEAKAALASAENLVQQRQAEIRRAERDFNMKKGLVGRRAVSESEFQEAEKVLAVVRSQQAAATDTVSEARARLEFLKVQISDLEVIAPLTGAVVDRRVEPGEWVGTGAVVASLVTLDPVEAWVRVPARYLAGSKLTPEGFRVRQSATGNIFQPSKVEKVAEVDPLSQLFVVIATVPNPEGRLTPGESVTGIVPVGTRQSYWKLPVNAVAHTPGGNVAYVIRPPAEEGALPTAGPVKLQVAFERDGMAYVATSTGAFNEGDQVVTEGNERLQPGQPVMPQPAGSPAARPAP